MTIVLKTYKSTISILLVMLFGKGCRFTPTCSEYATQAIAKYGIIKGTFIFLKRLGRCHPFGGSGYDPVA